MLSVKLNILLLCTITSISLFKGFSQNEFNNDQWNLAVNGIKLTDNISLSIRQHQFSNFESTLIEVPILLKIDINKKLSALLGTKLDFYRNNFGFSKDIGVSASIGIHYDVSPNTYIQGLLNYRINNVNDAYHYNANSHFNVMLNTGFKF